MWESLKPTSSTVPAIMHFTDTLVETFHEGGNFAVSIEDIDEPIYLRAYTLWASSFEKYDEQWQRETVGYEFLEFSLFAPPKSEFQNRYREKYGREFPLRWKLVQREWSGWVEIYLDNDKNLERKYGTLSSAKTFDTKSLTRGTLDRTLALNF